MKKVVFITLVVTAMLVSTQAYSQASFGLKGSFNMFNITGEDASGDKFDNKMIPTFDAGVFAEFPIAPEFVIRPEILYAGKGTKTDVIITDATLKLSYIEMPLLFLYKGALQGNSVLLGFGPYFALGVGGKAEAGNEEMDVKFKNDVTPADLLEAIYVKPFDFGAKMMAGYEFSGGLSFAVNASLGLMNMEPKISGVQSDAIMKNTGFGLSLGYRFGSN